MAATSPDTPHAGLSLAARSAFVALPLLSLCLLVGLLLVHDLPWVWRVDWVPALGIEAAFRVDGLSVLMLLMITGVGTGGHLTGCAEELKKHWPSMKAYGVEPALSPVINGGQLVDVTIVRAPTDRHSSRINIGR